MLFNHLSLWGYCNRAEYYALHRVYPYSSKGRNGAQSYIPAKQEVEAPDNIATIEGPALMDKALRGTHICNLINLNFFPLMSLSGKV